MRKKTFVHPPELWRNFICENETGNPGRAVSLHLARSGSQSEHRICGILPPRGACDIVKSIIDCLQFCRFASELLKKMSQFDYCLSVCSPSESQVFSQAFVLYGRHEQGKLGANTPFLLESGRFLVLHLFKIMVSKVTGNDDQIKFRFYKG